MQFSLYKTVAAHLRSERKKVCRGKWQQAQAAETRKYCEVQEKENKPLCRDVTVKRFKQVVKKGRSGRCNVCLSISPVAVINTCPKAALERKDFFQFILLGHSSLRREVRAGAQDRILGADTVEECCLIACSPMGSSSATFLIHSRLTSLRMVPPTGGWSFPHQSPIKKSSSRHGQSGQGNSSVEIRTNQDRFYVCVSWVLLNT